MHLYASLVATLFFAVIFKFAYSFWSRLFHGTEKHELVPEFSSYLMAALHGISICGIALWLLSNDNDWDNFDAKNTTHQNLALCLSLGYFIADTFVYLAPFTPHDTVFFVHHFGTAAFLIASLHLQKGGSACLIGLLLGEITNPFYHVYNLLNGLRKWHPHAESVFRWWAPLFTVVFLTVRTVCGPPASWWWCNKIIAMEEDVPWLHRMIWIFASVGVTIVSQLFSIGFVKDTYALLTSPPVHGKKTKKMSAKAQ